MSKSSISKEAISNWFKSLQQIICVELEHADGRGKFQTDAWDREGGGGGVSRIITDGNILEKGGVNYSAVWGRTPEATLKTLNLSDRDAQEFFATGVSVVIHPNNPMVPIIHMNVRYFEMSNGTWWFGGGIDLTPHYIDEADARYFHRTLKAMCDRHDPSYYSKFKEWADDYFYLKHRQEMRGVGGIFFDHLSDGKGFTKESRFELVQDVGRAFAPLYAHFMQKNHILAYGKKEKKWQMLRRGRYVEFNLVWDRGTKFGLETDGRTESILMSLPPGATWLYNHQPEKGSPEEKTISLLRKGVDWI